MKFKFNYQNKDYEVEVRECRDVFSQMIGLMFGFQKKPLLFVFKKTRKRAIHSFFCKPFIAIWFDNEKIVGIELVRPWRISVKPKEKFDKLLEIPENNDFFDYLSTRRNI